MTGNKDWSWLAQQTRDNSPLLKSQQFLQAAQGAGQAINNAGNMLQQGIRKKQYRAAGNDILGLMEQGQLNEQTMAGVLKKNRLGMQEAQEVIGLLQKSGALEELKARTAGINANTQATIGKEGRDADEYTWKQGNRDADRDLEREHTKSQINLNNANAKYAESGKASGNKPVDPADKVKDFIANHPQIENAMTPVKGTSTTEEQSAQPLSKEDAEYYQDLASKEGFELVLRPSTHQMGFWGGVFKDGKKGDTITDGYTIESVRYVGNASTGGGGKQPADNSAASKESPVTDQTAAALKGRPAGRYKVNGQIIAWDGTKVLN